MPENILSKSKTCCLLIKFLDFNGNVQFSLKNSFEWQNQTIDDRLISLLFFDSKTNPIVDILVFKK